MKTPTCKLRGKAHWTYEEHQGMESSVPEYVREMAKGALGHEKRIVVFPDPSPPEAITTVASTTGDEMVYVEPVAQKTCNACNKPYNNRGDVCNACRQKAYRGRK